jgi:hypothetical protein
MEVAVPALNTIITFDLKEPYKLSQDIQCPGTNDKRFATPTPTLKRKQKNGER